MISEDVREMVERDKAARGLDQNPDATRSRADQPGLRHRQTQENGKQDDPERAGQRATMTATLITEAEQGPGLQARREIRRGRAG